MTTSYVQESPYRPGISSIQVPKIALIPVAAAIAEISTHPMDFVKTNMQVKNSSITSAIKENFRLHGIGGFYKSIYPAVGRHLVYSTSRISIYENLKDKEDTFFKKALKGLFAGGFGQLLASPADLIKIQIQSDPSQKVAAVIRNIHRNYGMSGYFRGW